MRYFVFIYFYTRVYKFHGFHTAVSSVPVTLFQFLDRFKFEMTLKKTHFPFMKRTCTGKQEVCAKGNDVNFVFKRRNAGKPTILIVANVDGTLNQATIASSPRIFN